ncbi:MAG: CRISPR-associated endoribonuclease Cas6 [Candidatus Nitrosocaldaceae archaeon]
MRFCIIYNRRIQESYTIPCNYREYITTLIRDVLDDNANNLDSSNIVIPYTWALRLAKRPTIDMDGIHINDDNIKLYFSTNSRYIGTKVYNKLIVDKLKIGTLEFIPLKAMLFADRQINSTKASFYTLSPISIKNYTAKDNYNILPNEDGFNESFKRTLISQWKKFMNSSINIDIKFNITKWKKVVVKHYGGLVISFSGIIDIESRPELLNLIYNIGIGNRRGQGFGMLELVHGI